MALNVNIVTPTEAVFSGQATSVRVAGWRGEFEVLEGHDILLSLLRGGLTTVATPEGALRFITGRGFVEAGPDHVTLLADSCVSTNDTDRDAARQALANSDEAKSGAIIGSLAWEAAEEQAEIAKAQLSA